MAAIDRHAEAQWEGALRTGKGEVTTDSGVLKNTPTTFGMRFQNEPGTNPEELIAAAHAVCYCMILSSTLGKRDLTPTRITTRTTVSLDPQHPGGTKITRSRLEVTAEVPGLDENTFREIAQEAERACPVSNALRAIDIELDARLLNT